MIVYAHMMKTAGTAFSKTLIGNYGRNFHQVPGGLSLSTMPFGKRELEFELKRPGRKLKCISGHRMRPYINYGDLNEQIVWVTFLRNPINRVISHYFHDKYKRESHFKHVPGSKSIIDWAQYYEENNYQTRFISGEENAQKAIEILENKFFFIGITEYYDKSLSEMLSNFNLFDTRDFVRSKINKGGASKTEKDEVLRKYHHYLIEKNKEDLILYEYFKNKYDETITNGAKVKVGNNIINRIKYNFNFWNYHIYRQSNLRTEKVNYKNLRRFFNRWF